MKENKEQKWIVADEEDCIHVIPDWDTKPHADVLNPIMGKFEISKEECQCKPFVRIQLADSTPIKKMIVHNSFLHEEIINNAMNNIN